MRIFATSDLHVDFRENWQFLKQLSDAEFRQDALIVAGDMAHRLTQIEAALSLLKAKFSEVFYVPGNHELWVRGEPGDSLEKFYRILVRREEMGVRTYPGRVDGYCVVPLFSWYHPAFGSEYRTEEADLDGWGDFRFCRWPEDLDSQSGFFSCLNQPHIHPRPEKVISFSHFLPRPELLPDPVYLRFRGLPKVAGCRSIERQIRALGARVHVFGHTHTRRDVAIDQVRYVQHGLGYPRERQGRVFELKRID